MAYLWWERWQERPAILLSDRHLSWWWIAANISIGAVELPLRLLLTPFPLWPMLLLIYSVLLAGVTIVGAWLLAGRDGVRWIAGPLVLMAAALPFPSWVQVQLIGPLRAGMANLAAEISNAAGHPALAVGTSVQVANAWVGIDEACGGIRSLQACIMIALFFGEWYRMRLTSRALLVVGSIASAIAGNFGRVLFLCLRANAGVGAIHAAHDGAGWSAMIVSLAITGIIGWWVGGRKLPKIRAGASQASAAVTTFGMKTITCTSTGWVVAVAVVLTCNEVGTRLWFRSGAATREQMTQWTARLPDRLSTFHAEPLEASAREMLKPDVFLAGRWEVRRDVRASAYYVAWTRGQLARSVPFLHNPTVCLPYSGCELVSELPPITVQWKGGTIPFRAYRFHAIGGDLLVAFTIWDTDRNTPLKQPEETHGWKDWWLTQWSEVRLARQHQPAQLLSIALPWSDLARTDALALLTEVIY